MDGWPRRSLAAFGASSQCRLGCVCADGSTCTCVCVCVCVCVSARVRLSRRHRLRALLARLHVCLRGARALNVTSTWSRRAFELSPSLRTRRTCVGGLAARVAWSWVSTIGSSSLAAALAELDTKARQLPPKGGCDRSCKYVSPRARPQDGGESEGEARARRLRRRAAEVRAGAQAVLRVSSLRSAAPRGPTGAKSASVRRVLPPWTSQRQGLHCTNGGHRICWGCMVET